MGRRAVCGPDFPLAYANGGANPAEKRGVFFGFEGNFKIPKLFFGTYVYLSKLLVQKSTVGSLFPNISHFRTSLVWRGYYYRGSFRIFSFRAPAK